MPPPRELLAVFAGVNVNTLNTYYGYCPDLATSLVPMCALHASEDNLRWDGSVADVYVGMIMTTGTRQWRP